jgi:KaiC/GvpD/RAD55 family RecA-like ATPase
MARLATGIEELDRLLYGGFPDRMLLLLQGFPGCGSSEFAQQFLSFGLQNQGTGIYFTSKKTSFEVLESMKYMLPDVEKYYDRKKLVFLDSYTPRLKEFAVQYGLASPEDTRGEVLWNIGPLEKLSGFFTDSIKGMSGDIRVIVDNLSYLLRGYELDKIVDLIEKMQFAARIYGGVYMILLMEAMHDPKTIATIADMVDGVIQFQEKLKQTSLVSVMRFVKMDGTDFNTRNIPYVTVRNGIQYRTTVRGVEFEKAVL